ncbi:MAG: hypothetical protein E7576_01075 [Ruminococcaceae bacterium]|nr:hypothetical protein [Oscillospiraceae bacterium]
MGITERTVKLPAGRGAEQKDFYVTINTILGSPCTVVKPTVHVVIPAAEIDPEAELQDDDAVLTDAVSLKDNVKETWGCEAEFRENGYSFYGRTAYDDYGQIAGISVYLPGAGGYAYDGFRLKFVSYRNWCDADYSIDVYNTQNHQIIVNELNVPDDKSGTRTHDQYYNQAEGMGWARFYICNLENHWEWFRDCHVRTWIESLQMICRKFNFTVEDAAPLPLAGGGVANLGFTVGDSLRRSFSRVMGEDFTLNQIVSTDQARIRGIEVKKADSDEWRRIMLSGGTDSGSVTYTLTEEQINTLGKDGYIRWTTKDSKTEGNITVRPIFDYVDVQVEVRDNPYGFLYTGGLSVEDYDSAKEPSLLWDFGTDWEMDSHMGSNDWLYTSWYSEADEEGNDYFVFLTHGDDPKVSIDLSAPDASDVAWAKIRAKNLSDATAIELYRLYRLRQGSRRRGLRPYQSGTGQGVAHIHHQHPRGKRRSRQRVQGPESVGFGVGRKSELDPARPHVEKRRRRDGEGRRDADRLYRVLPDSEGREAVPYRCGDIEHRRRRPAPPRGLSIPCGRHTEPPHGNDGSRRAGGILPGRRVLSAFRP